MTRTALITGGTRGIGEGIAIMLKKHGYNVIATYYGNDEKAQSFSKAHSIPAYKWDVSQFESCANNITLIEEKHGIIDILVNNAGITRDGPLHKMTSTMWTDVITTNLNSCFNMTRCVIEGMRERGFGRIVNLSSVNAVRGQAGQVNYAAAKAGVIGFTKALALESASKGITVNAIAPGYIDTDMVRAVPETILDTIIKAIPTKRLGDVEEIARTVLFLVDDNAGYINGATLHINGGQYMAA